MNTAFEQNIPKKTTISLEVFDHLPGALQPQPFSNHLSHTVSPTPVL
jgi:hypothetical protein